jgi:hypothetical protein
VVVKQSIIASMAIEDADDKKSHTCVDCGTTSPTTETNYTLISARHGWRLTLGQDEHGARVMQWRCPSCWARHRLGPR